MGFYVTFNTVQVISGGAVLWAEETNTYSWPRFCTVNCTVTTAILWPLHDNKSNISVIKHIHLFIYLGFYIAFNTVQVISRRVVRRAEETSTYSSVYSVLYCKLPTNGKQLPAFPLEAVPGTGPRPQRWEARVLPLCHRDPYKTYTLKLLLMKISNIILVLYPCVILPSSFVIYI